MEFGVGRNCSLELCSVNADIFISIISDLLITGKSRVGIKKGKLRAFMTKRLSSLYVWDEI